MVLFQPALSKTRYVYGNLKTHIIGTLYFRMVGAFLLG